MSENSSEYAGLMLSKIYVPLITGPGRRERARVARELASVTVVGKDEIEKDKYYGQCAGGWIEITDKLLTNHVCPSDLLDMHCEWDDLLPEGCGMIRLCKIMSKYTSYICPDGGLQDVESAHQPRECIHIHSEVDISCRFMVNGRRCKQVLDKGRMCSAGHDLEAARMKAREAYRIHKAAARAAGSCEQVKS